MLVWMERNTVMKYKVTCDGREVQVGLLHIITILVLSPVDPPILESEGLVNRGQGKSWEGYVMGKWTSSPIRERNRMCQMVMWSSGMEGAVKQEERCGVS